MKKFLIVIFSCLLLTSCCLLPSNETNSANTTCAEETMCPTESTMESSTEVESQETSTESNQEYWVEFNVPEGYLVQVPISDDPYIAINDNTPYFILAEYENTSFEIYGELDALGRCTICIANIGQDLMPTDERGSISSIYPTGWKYNGKNNNNKYDFVSAKYIYNRCHLIGWQLTGENANKQNLITGTRQLNIDGMLIFENMVADYVKETNNHVLYRVIPVFENDDLLAKGVLIEACSMEDNGDSILFCIFSYNVQPGVNINYHTGENSAE